LTENCQGVPDIGTSDCEDPAADCYESGTDPISLLVLFFLLLEQPLQKSKAPSFQSELR